MIYEINQMINKLLIVVINKIRKLRQLTNICNTFCFIEILRVHQPSLQVNFLFYYRFVFFVPICFFDFFLHCHRIHDSVGFLFPITPLAIEVISHSSMSLLHIKERTTFGRDRFKGWWFGGWCCRLRRSFYNMLE